MSVYVKQNSITIGFNSSGSWTILSPIEQSIKAKIEAIGTPLRDWNIKINSGIKTGCNEAFIISGERKDELIREDPKSAEIIRPILRGRDIKRYGYEFANQYLIATHNGYTDDNRIEVRPIDIESYPAIKAHLDLFWDAISKRTDQGVTPYNLRNCAYMDDFSKQKIVWSDISTEPTFSIINERIFINNTCYMITNAPIWLIDYLNSPIVTWYFPKIATDLGSNGVRYFKQFVEKIPVPNTFDIKNELAEFSFTDYEKQYLYNVIKNGIT